MAGALHRAGDLAARYGGEEFAVILPDTDAAGAHAVAQAIRCRVANLGLPHARSAHHVVTVSVGVVTLIPPRQRTDDARQVVGMADARLYDAKHGGRNGVRASVFG